MDKIVVMESSKVMMVLEGDEEKISPELKEKLEKKKLEKKEEIDERTS